MEIKFIILYGAFLLQQSNLHIPLKNIALRHGLINMKILVCIRRVYMHHINILFYIYKEHNRYLIL